MIKILEAANPKNKEINAVLIDALCSNDRNRAKHIMNGYTVDGKRPLSQFDTEPAKRNMSTSIRIVSPTLNEITILADNDFYIFSPENFDKYDLLLNNMPMPGTTKNTDIDLYSLLMNRDYKADRNRRDLEDISPEARRNMLDKEAHQSISNSIRTYKVMREQEKENAGRIFANDNPELTKFYSAVRVYAEDIAVSLGERHSTITAPYKRSEMVRKRKAELQHTDYVPAVQVVDLPLKIGFDSLAIVAGGKSSGNDYNVITVIVDFSRLINQPYYGLIFIYDRWGISADAGMIQVVSNIMDMKRKDGNISMETMLMLTKFIANTTKVNAKIYPGFTVRG